MSFRFDAIGPELIVTVTALAVMLGEAFTPRNEKMPLGVLALFGLVCAGGTAGFLWGRDMVSFGVVSADRFGLFFVFVVIAVGVLTVLLSFSYAPREGLDHGEYYALLLFSIVGMMLMASATELLVIFLALEILSLAVYVLTGFTRHEPASVEGAVKYFLLGAFSSAFFLYGIALIYGLSGSTHLDRIAGYLSSRGAAQSPLAFVAVGLLLVGFSFKIAAVPFHMWTPDAYEGAPTAITGFMSTGVKAAAFGGFLRVFATALAPFERAWTPLVWMIAAATMIGGSVIAVAQTNMKRMLAYSTIAHSGYILIALVALNDVGKAGVLFYLLAYVFTNLGAFGIVALLGRRGEPNEQLSDYAGLWQAHPGLAAAMTVFLLSLGGLPPTAGFIAKWYVFSAAIRAGYVGLALIGVVTSIVSVFFYLRVIVNMYMAEERRRLELPRLDVSAVAVLAIAVVAIFYLGILPTRALAWAASAAATIF